MLWRSPAWDQVVYWALDLETGGLDPRRDPILAVGMVPIRAGAIRLREAYRTLVRPEDGRSIDPESVRAHQILWGEVARAPPVRDVLREVERRLREGVLLVHQRRIDVGFLKDAFERRAKDDLRWPAPTVVDTVDLLGRLAHLRHPGQAIDLIPTNLSKARARHGLPAYQAHDALTDAIATAELFLVLRRQLGARTLRDLR